MVSKNTKIYGLTIGTSLMVVGSFFATQVLFVLQTFKPAFAFVPILLAITIGFLIGKVQILRQEIAQKERLFHAITDDAREFSYFSKLDGSYEYVSPAAETLTGYAPERFYAVRNFFYTLILEEDRALWERHFRDILEHDSRDTLEFRIRNRAGETVWVSHSCSVVYDEGKPVGIRSVNADITQRKHDEIAIKKLVEFDSLTGLPNRLKIMQHIDALMADGTPFALMFIDLNRFKTINDTLGHQIGDQVLVQVADQLRRCNHEQQFVGRLGGDEFIACKTHVSNKAEVDEMARRLFELIEHDYTVGDYTFYIGVSIGIAFFPGDSRERHELLICADKAMYSAKLARNASIVYFNAIHSESALQQVLLEKELRSALSQGELVVYLQPKVNALTDSILSYEALVRWKRLDKMFYPDQFIPIAEETGLIKELTMYVLDTVFAIAAQWHEKRLLNIISINISMVDFMSDQFIDNVRRALDTHNVKAEWFELEMTETIFLEPSHIITAKIRRLSEMGFKIALDDFGTGYSSLSYLTKLPIDILKIDKVFIANLHDDYERNIILLKGIIDMATALGYQLVCEGVETQADVALLLELGCPVVQGYYFYEPMSVEAVEALGIAER